MIEMQNPCDCGEKHQLRAGPDVNVLLQFPVVNLLNESVSDSD